ncbi:MAG: helix-turn-helix domain-containing protein [Bacteroidales bacterium]
MQQHARIQHEAEPNEGYIRKLIAEGEHQQLDFKFGINDSRKIARTLAAFANTDGGRLLIGVKDNGSIAGVRSEEEFYMIQAASEMFTKPIVPFEVKEWTVNQKRVLEIIVPAIKGTLHTAPVVKDKYLIYIRVNDENYPVNSVWLKAYKWKNLKTGTFIKFTESEKFLLDYLEKEPSVTQSKYCKLAKINSKTAENIIAGFVAIGMISIVFTKHGVVYKLSDVYTKLTPEQRLKEITIHVAK